MLAKHVILSIVQFKMQTKKFLKFMWKYNCNLNKTSIHHENVLPVFLNNFHIHITYVILMQFLNHGTHAKLSKIDLVNFPQIKLINKIIKF